MRGRVFRSLVVLLLAAGIAAAVTQRDRFGVGEVEAWIDGLGPWAPVAFLAAYLVAPALFLPGSPLTIAAGAIFGVVGGGLLSLLGATGGATIAFLIARHLAGDWVERRASGRLREIRDGVDREGWRFVAVVRLVPVFPFNLVNYAFGLTRISAATFAFTSFLAMAPGAFAYAYIGHVGRELAAGGSGLVQKSLLAIGILAALAVLPSIVRRWRRPSTITPRELRDRLSGDDPPVVIDVRSAEEWAGELGHVEGALLVPLPELGARIGELALHKRRLVVPV
jgi:uncharacterized membrane protein YdjX (TVP38/TMEM64 family)